MVSISNSRLPDESFAEYKQRQKIVAKGLRLYLKGRMVWRSKNFSLLEKGDTFIKKHHAAGY